MICVDAGILLQKRNQISNTKNLPTKIIMFLNIYENIYLDI